MDYFATYSVLLEELPGFAVDFFLKKNDIYQIRTKVAYARDLKNFFLWILEVMDTVNADDISGLTIEDIKKITDQDIDMYLLYLDAYEKIDYRAQKVVLQNKASSKRRKLATLRVFFKYLKKTGKIENNPTELTDSPKLREDKSVMVLSNDEKKNLIHAAVNGKVKIKKGQSERGKKRQETLRDKTHIRDTTILSLFLSAGIRVSELCEINLLDIDFQEQSIIVYRKGGSKDLVYFDYETKELMELYRDTERNELLHIIKDTANDSIEDGPFFLARGGKRITVRRVQQIVAEYAKYAIPTNKKVSPHTLRKTFGTQVYRIYRDLTMAQNALGHKNSSTTSKHYVQFDKDRLKVLRDGL